MSAKTYELTSADLESNKAQLLDGLSILNNPQEFSAYFDNDSLSNFFEYLDEFTQENFDGENSPAICDFLLNNDFLNHLIRLNQYFSQICELLKHEDFKKIQESRKSTVFVASLSITNFLFSYCGNSMIKYLENDGLRYLLTIVDNETFCSNFHDHFAIEKILLNITLLSGTCDSTKHEWTKLDAVNILLKCAKKDQKWQLNAYNAALRVIDDEEIEKLDDLTNILGVFLTLLNKASTDIVNYGEQLQREKRDFIDDKQNIEKYDVYCIPDDSDENTIFPLTGVLGTFYRLAVNDKIKYDLYVKYNVKDPLRIILFKGSVIERDFGFKLLAQLCFDPQVRDIVSMDSDLKTLIETTANNEQSLRTSAYYCKQIFWSSNDGKTQKRTLVKTEKLKSKDDKIQIMMSYNADSRDLCLKIKAEMESVGYKIWIDVEEIHGSSLESMANAVETSQIIFLCVTEKYRQSVNCQAEAQYAFKLKKPVIPLILQKGFEKVGGWLGMIMGDKIYISFTKHPFEVSIKRLLSQIELIRRSFQPASLADDQDTSLVQVTEAKGSQVKEQIIKEQVNEAANVISSWTEDEVYDWFKKNGDKKIYKHLKPCNGDLLKQLYKIKVEAPESYYQIISIKNKLCIREILIFTQNLEKLFGKQT